MIVSADAMSYPADPEVAFVGRVALSEAVVTWTWKWLRELSEKRLLSAVSVVKESRACWRLCTLGRGVQADASGLVQASNSIGSLVLVLC